MICSNGEQKTPKGETGIFSAMQDIERTLPFKIKGLGSDNRGEFLDSLKQG